MLSILRSRAVLVRGFTFLAVAIALLLWLAPAEKTMGTGMRSVYLHVGLIWTGIAGFGVGGLLGLLVLFRNDTRLDVRGDWRTVSCDDMRRRLGCGP